MFPLLIALCSVHVTRRLRGVGPDVLPPGGVNTHRGVRLGESRVSARPDRLRYDRCKYGRRFSLTPLAPRWLALAPVACRAFRSWLPGGRATGLRYACRTRLCAHPWFSYARCQPYVLHLRDSNAHWRRITTDRHHTRPLYEQSNADRMRAEQSNAGRTTNHRESN